MPIKYGPYGAWVTTNFGDGNISLIFLVQVINHCSPVPISIAALSSKSKSTPSKLLSSTNWARAEQTMLASREEGISVDPKAETINFLPISLFSLKNNYLDHCRFSLCFSVCPVCCFRTPARSICPPAPTKERYRRVLCHWSKRPAGSACNRFCCISDIPGPVGFTEENSKRKFSLCKWRRFLG